MTKSNVNYLSFRFIDVLPSRRFDARTTRRVGENERRTKAKQEKSTPYRLLTRQQVREYSFCYFTNAKSFRTRLHFQENRIRSIKNSPDTSVRQIFKFISLGNKASDESILFYVFNLFPRVVRPSVDCLIPSSSELTIFKHI